MRIGELLWIRKKQRRRRHKIFRNSDEVPAPLPMTLWFDNLILSVGLEPYVLRLSRDLPIVRQEPRQPLWHTHGVKTGFLSICNGPKNAQRVRVQLSTETITLQKEESFVVNPVDPHGGHETNGTEVDSARERVITIRRQKVGGLGLSIKGGAEHNIPILVSRIFKDQAADQTGELYVGDAILKVNGLSIERATHDEAVIALKNAGNEVQLTVRHFRAATPYLKQAAKLADRGKSPDNNNTTENSLTNGGEGWQTRNASSTTATVHNQSPRPQPKLQTRWVDMLSISLLMARVTRYSSGTDKIRPNTFEVIGVDGTSSGTLLCQSSTELLDWLKVINSSVATLNAQSMKLSNDLLPPVDQIMHFGWVEERLASNSHHNIWKPKFLAIRGADALIFESPPVNPRDWIRCERSYKLFEVVSRIFKDSELQDDRAHCFLLQSGADDCHYLSVENRSELNVWQSAVLRATHASVSKLGTKTYGCTWRKRVVGLTLDLETGFTLFDAHNKALLWRYRFSQLKNSSDDGNAKVKLQFTNANTGQLEMQELECPNLRKLLHCMHAFLASKLAAIDPIFLRSTTQLPCDS
ncbi:gamma-2-syntrophin-like isoform X1 [Lytechinus pictus]|uniref:gamma-2-syntrophin-like isoform X1 n=1 Tax=Lytechinus pictus TaxID=7653 RepID=UPI0030BA1DFD